MTSNRCLDIAAPDSPDPVRLQLTTCNTTPAQRFTLDEDQHLVNAHSGMCLGAVGQSTASGALIEQRSCDAGTDHLRWTRR
ncbi:ricin-type beta-trefoil lectin domain protein [Micromonospora sp. NPDC049101]|uniref:RICIN domain-containing protein n=1 Tax=unclassified Micromonospora TaxID=2617518 RepID=UPI00340DF87E